MSTVSPEEPSINSSQDIAAEKEVLEIVEACIKKDFTVYDDETQILYDPIREQFGAEYGEKLFQQYVEQVATYMAYSDVAAYEQHDAAQNPDRFDTYITFTQDRRKDGDPDSHLTFNDYLQVKEYVQQNGITVEDYLDEDSASLTDLKEEAKAAERDSGLAEDLTFADVWTEETEDKKRLEPGSTEWKEAFYSQCTESFIPRYTFLYPVSRSDAQEAASLMVNALREQDQIEDGDGRIPEIGENSSADETQKTAKEMDARAVRDDPRWFNVHSSLASVADILNLDTYQGESYEECMTGLLRDDAASREPESATEITKGQYLLDALDNAEKAKKSELATVLHDEENDSLDEKDRRAIEGAGRIYIEVVKGHNEHSELEQWKNVERMTDIYRKLLEPLFEKHVLPDENEDDDNDDDMADGINQAFISYASTTGVVA